MAQKAWGTFPLGFVEKITAERRASPRYPIEAEVHIENGPLVADAQTQDICEDGFMLNTEISPAFRNMDLHVTLTYISSKGITVVSHIEARLVADSLARVEVLQKKSNLQLFLEQIWGL